MRFPGMTVAVLLALSLLAMPAPAQAGKLSWLDDVVREVIAEARAGSKSVVKGGQGARVELRSAGTFRAARRRGGPGAACSPVRRAGAGRPAGSSTLARPCSRAGSLAFWAAIPMPSGRSRPSSRPRSGWWWSWVRPLARLAAAYHGGRDHGSTTGSRGLSAVHVFGDDVAEVMVKEGPESLNVLRKTGRGGWSFFRGQVLPHKKKLLAAGVLAAFLADPDRFVDYTGQATEFAVRDSRGRHHAGVGGRRGRLTRAGVVARRGPSPPMVSITPRSAIWAWSLASLIVVGALVRSSACRFVSCSGRSGYLGGF